MLKSKMSLISICFLFFFFFLVVRGWVDLPGMMNGKLQFYVIGKVNDAARADEKRVNDAAWVDEKRVNNAAWMLRRYVCQIGRMEKNGE